MLYIKVVYMRQMRRLSGGIFLHSNQGITRNTEWISMADSNGHYGSCSRCAVRRYTKDVAKNRIGLVEVLSMGIYKHHTVLEKIC